MSAPTYGGIPIIRSVVVPLGTSYVVDGRLVIGDARRFAGGALGDYPERAYREALLDVRRIVRDGLRRYDPRPMSPDAIALERILINPELAR